MVSFRFLNPGLVDRISNGVCFKGIGDEPDVLCRDLPRNQQLFLARWYISPERHFWEWLGFTIVGMTILFWLGPKLSSKAPSSPNAIKTALIPRCWMKASTVLLYPYVAHTKLSWPDSNYPGRWLLFVGMPVGTLWILSVVFCCNALFTSLSRQKRSDEYRHKLRFWLLEAWFSFLPLLVDVLPALFYEAVSSLRIYASGKVPRSGQNGDNAAISYFCHGLYLVLVPLYYCWIGELSSQPTRNSYRVLWSNLLDSTLRQLVGTAIVVIYYMGIITPASIVFGVNANFLLWADGGPNFRIFYVAKCFFHGCLIRYMVETAKFIMHTIQRRPLPGDDAVNDGDSETQKQQV